MDAKHDGAGVERRAALEKPGWRVWVGLRLPTNRIHRRKAGVEGSMPESRRSLMSHFDPEETFDSAESRLLVWRIADCRLERGLLIGFTPSTLFAYALFAYSAHMVFVELTPFVAFRDEYWTDEDFRAMQSYLLASPEAGDLIQGGSGLRKLRWSAQGRGKRGGARVIYYWHKPKHHVYLIYGYVKSEREDLSPQQIRVLAELMKDVKDG